MFKMGTNKTMYKKQDRSIDLSNGMQVLELYSNITTEVLATQLEETLLL